MFSASFARAEAAYLEPPEPQFVLCTCGDSDEDRNGFTGCDECDCTEFTEYTAEQARWDAESESGDAARKERGIDD